MRFSSFLPSSYSTLFVRTLSISSMCRTFPVIYRKSGQNSTCSKSWIHLTCFVLSLLSELFHIIMFLEWFYVQDDPPLWKSILMSYFLGCYGFIFVAKCVLAWRQDETRELIERAVELEKLSSKSHPIRVRVTPVLICVMFLFTTVSLPSVMFLMALVRPCMPPFFSMSLLECKSWSSGGGASVPLRLGIAVFEFITWFTSLANAVTIGLVGLVVYPPVVEEMWIDVVEREFQNSVSLYSTAVKYRIAQSMSNLHGSVMRKPFMSMIIGGVMMVEITSLYLVINSIHELPTPVAMFFIILAMDFFVVIHLLFKSLCRPHLASVELVNKAKMAKRGKWLDKYLKSCVPLELSMGGGCFFDRLSSFVIWKFCVDQVVNLLVM
ncbi:uncharacterized protein LOC118433875 [Folsomia candida]|uniref:Gustatory receptor n=1 Tax=Folsomia candida TaxID=158441 RepID=A0A226EZX5_FOLCA|nr:uncharacterized protein LOC118433875 [Folsomia candida]OXA62690.1 hypothetical protein Fcan01_00743 [Folsomia candida]